MGASWTGQEPEEACDPQIKEAIARWYQRQSRDDDIANAVNPDEGDVVRLVDTESWDRLSRAMDWIAEKGREGQLTTRGRLVAGGDYFDLSPSVWNIESFWQTRFATCQFIHEGQATYLFVTQKTLDRCLAHHRSPAAGSAGAEKGCERWLRDEFSKSSTRHRSKSEFKAEANTRFAGLSGEAFGRAWGNATVDFPERRIAGAKPKRD